MNRARFLLRRLHKFEEYVGCGCPTVDGLIRHREICIRDNYRLTIDELGRIVVNLTAKISAEASVPVTKKKGGKSVRQ
jgi:hypothetical protein